VGWRRGTAASSAESAQNTEPGGTGSLLKKRFLLQPSAAGNLAEFWFSGCSRRTATACIT
jgi:hypothetical protein